MSAQPAASVALVGAWRTVGAGQHGIHLLMELDGDGRARRWLVVMLDGRYEVEGNELTVTLATVGGAEQEPPIARTWRREGEQLLVTMTLEEDGKANTTTYRPHKEIGDGVVGEWTTPHSTGADAYVRFAADGTWAFRLPMLAAAHSEGAWRMEDGRLGVTWAGAASGTTERLTPSPDGDSLLDAMGAVDFARVDVPWYPVTR